VGLLLGILLALARINRDSEMSALLACGVGPLRLLLPIGLLSLGLAGGVAWLSLLVAPAANLAIERIQFQARAASELGTMVAGRFNEFDDGRIVLYAREVDGNQLRGVFMQSESDGQIVVVIAADGEWVGSVAGGDSSLVLSNGRRYVGTPGSRQFYMEAFGEHGIPIRIEPAEFEPAIESRPTSGLLGSADSADRAELQWRIAAPLSILILSLLAVPLGRSSPREGRYARVGLGLLIYLIYSNSLSIALVWLERGTVPAWLGAWWVHALIGLLAMLMLVRQEGLGQRSRTVAAVRHEPIG
jgi:lipopolysaccharide export system permease protein